MLDKEGTTEQAFLDFIWKRIENDTDLESLEYKKFSSQVLKLEKTLLAKLDVETKEIYSELEAASNAEGSYLTEQGYRIGLRDGFKLKKLMGLETE